MPARPMFGIAVASLALIVATVAPAAAQSEGSDPGGGTSVAAGAPVASAPDGATVVAGGGSLSNQIVPLPRGESIAPIHSVYIINRTAAPITANWYESVPSGVQLIPSVKRVTLQPGENSTVVYSVRTDPAMVVGDYQIQVGLTIENTDPATGQVTFVPGFRSDWTLRLVDSKARVDVRVKNGTKNDVVTLSRVNDTSSFEMARAQGGSLSQVVAPGAWRAEVQREGRPLANRTFVIGDDQRLQITLDARTARTAVGIEAGTPTWVWLILGLGAGVLLGVGVVAGWRWWRGRRAVRSGHRDVPPAGSPETPKSESEVGSTP